MTVWDVFRQKKAFIIGMVHCQPLLGRPVLMEAHRMCFIGDSGCRNP